MGLPTYEIHSLRIWSRQIAGLDSTQSYTADQTDTGSMDPAPTHWYLIKFGSARLFYVNVNSIQTL
ncbi:hypothetical protein INS49_013985 [Diaporthe citri]|uniref:uncharacterized protein n=1 Tax=Diaporthe citri TaxID=83186 RepID=UPI001C807924|nr:uncharacterized protein INS49_013985 [Diaporthe citri]KAG6358101.1 hypothetical protein INS49_013985 [Diaporthe citri]